MTIKEVVNAVFDSESIKNGLVGFYEEDKNGTPKKIYPEYADEIIETHGNDLVADYVYLDNHNLLVISLNSRIPDWRN